MAESGDLKNSGVFIAGSTVAATIALAVLVYKEVLLPTHTLSLQNEIATLKTENATHIATIGPLEQNNRSLKEQINLLRARVRELEAANLFALGNPYPVGFGAVRVGNPIADVEKAFPKESIEKRDDGFWSVKVDHTTLRSITYYFLSDRKIYQILFHVKSDGRTSKEEDASFLKAKLSDALGAPATNPKPSFFSWNVLEKTKVYVDDTRTFLLTDLPSPPRGWPRNQ